MLRNRMLADPTFLFKIGTEVCIFTLLAAIVGLGTTCWICSRLLASLI